MVHNDNSLDMDKSKVTALNLLDVSAAIDPTDQDILIRRLSMWNVECIFGIALCWIARTLLIDWYAAHLMRCPARLWFGAIICHSLYNATKLCLPKAQLGSLSLCRWHTNLHFFGHTIYLSLPKPANQLKDCLQDISLRMENSKLKLMIRPDFSSLVLQRSVENLRAFSWQMFWVKVSHQPRQC